PARSGNGSRPRRLSSAQLHAAAVVAFVAAAGVLTFIMARELQRERAPAGAIEASVQAAEPKGVAQRVSPSTMLGNARDESRSATAPAESDASNPPIVMPALAEPKSERPPKAKTVAAKPPVVLDPP